MRKIISIIIGILFLWSNLAMGEPIKQNMLRLPMKFTGKVEPRQIRTTMSDSEIKEFYGLSEILRDEDTHNRIKSAKQIIIQGPIQGTVTKNLRGGIPIEEALQYYYAGLLIGAFKDSGEFVLVCPDIEIALKMKENLEKHGFYEIFKELADQKIEANKRLAWQRLKELAEKRQKGENVFFPIIAIGAVIDDFNHYNPGRNYSIYQVEQDADKQLEIMNWLGTVIDMRTIYWFMNLEDVQRAVLEANKEYLSKNGVTVEIGVTDDVGAKQKTKVKAEGDRSKIGINKLVKPDINISISLRGQIDFIRKAKEENKDRSVLAWIPAPCTLAAKIYDETQFNLLIGMVVAAAEVSEEKKTQEDKDNIKRFNDLMEYAYLVVEDYARALVEAGADVICLLDPSGPQLLGPANFAVQDKLIIRKTNDIIKIIRNKGISTVYHPCGFVGACLDKDIIGEVETDAYSFGYEANGRRGQEKKNEPPFVFVRNRIAEFHERLMAKNRPAIFIGISESRNFNKLGPEAAFNDASKVVFNKTEGLAEVEKDGCLIPGSSCEILETSSAPAESIGQLIALQEGFRPKSNRIDFAEIGNLTNQRLASLNSSRNQL